MAEYKITYTTGTTDSDMFVHADTEAEARKIGSYPYEGWAVKGVERDGVPVIATRENRKRLGALVGR